MRKGYRINQVEIVQENIEFENMVEGKTYMYTYFTKLRGRLQLPIPRVQFTPRLTRVPTPN